MSYRVALTGGIGSGKSTVADLFAEQGVAISDADVIAHALTAPGGDALPAIQASFGHALVDTAGYLDRKALRALVFSDPSARRHLEQILHPLIRARMLAETENPPSPYALLVIPLLIETGQDKLADRVLVVDLPESEQIRRVAQRSGLAQDEIQRIMAAQAPRRQRLAAADDVINNSGSREALTSAVLRLHQQYLHLADRA